MPTDMFEYAVLREKGKYSTAFETNAYVQQSTQLLIFIHFRAHFPLNCS